MAYVAVLCLLAVAGVLAYRSSLKLSAFFLWAGFIGSTLIILYRLLFEPGFGLGWK